MANEEVKMQNMVKALETAYLCFLEFGIEFVTKEMISKKSGISRASLNRYWVDRTDCVIRVAEWFREMLKDKFEKQHVTSNWEKLSGIAQLQAFMEWCRNLYIEDPHIISLYTEIKVYLHRSVPGFWESNRELVTALGFHSLIAEIYEKGIKDGTIHISFEKEYEILFLGDAFMGYLSNMAFRSGGDGHKDENDINRYIQRVLDSYR